MRYLSNDEVLKLETFLVEDNDEAVGIEIHTGLFDRTKENGITIGYNRPDTIKSVSLEELAGGELIKFGDWTLCAVVCNRLYCRNSNDLVYSTGTAVAFHGKSHDDSFEYERVVLTFNCPVVPLPDEEVLALEECLVRDNKRVIGVRIIPGSRGIGDSNAWEFIGEGEKIAFYDLKALSKCGPINIEGYEACALVNDVLHFRYAKSNGEKSVFTIDYREQAYTLNGQKIAPDTISATRVILILK